MAASRKRKDQESYKRYRESSNNVNKITGLPLDMKEKGHALAWVKVKFVLLEKNERERES